MPCFRVFRKIKLSSAVADIFGLAGIEEQIANGCNEGVNTKSKISQNKIRPGSGSESYRLKRSVVDDKASNPSKEEGEKKANEIFSSNVH